MTKKIYAGLQKKLKFGGLLTVDEEDRIRWLWLS